MIAILSISSSLMVSKNAAFYRFPFRSIVPCWFALSATPPPCCPLAPITAINFLLLDDMSIPRFFVSISLSQLLSCNVLLEEPGESGADTQKHNDPEHRHDESQRQPARKHQCVNEQNVDDDRSEQRQREWDVSIDQKQD